MLARESNQEIVIIDPEPSSVEPLRQRLSEHGFALRCEAYSKAATAAILEQPPSLVILDWNIPGTAPLEFIRRVRAIRTPRMVRLIILSSLSAEHDVVTGLDSGADDFIAKPYSPREVVARVVAVLRSQRRFDQKAAMSIDNLELNAITNRVSARGQLLNLRGAEYRLLEFLMTHAGRTFSRDQLLSQVWGKDADVDIRTVDVNVQRLRRILEQPGYQDYIQTVRGFGYRFAVP